MKLRIIVLDLDKNVRDLISIIARQNGHEVLALPEPLACSLYSELGCSCLHEYACGDLMIIDNRMLKMSAFDLIRRQKEGGCKLATKNKLVLSTTGSEKEELQFAKEIGFKLIKKPFKFDEISKWIDVCEKKY